MQAGPLELLPDSILKWLLLCQLFTRFYLKMLGWQLAELQAEVIGACRKSLDRELTVGGPTLWPANSRLVFQLIGKYGIIPSPQILIKSPVLSSLCVFDFCAALYICFLPLALFSVPFGQMQCRLVITSPPECSRFPVGPVPSRLRHWSHCHNYLHMHNYVASLKTMKMTSPYSLGIFFPRAPLNHICPLLKSLWLVMIPHLPGGGLFTLFVLGS